MVLIAALCGFTTSACLGSLPRPDQGRTPEDTMLEVPYPPPPGRVETVPEQPADMQVWIDGQWDWTGDDYRWLEGGWAVPPAGARFTPWTTLRKKDGRLYFAPAAWRDQNGRVVAAWPSSAPCDVPRPEPTASQ